MNFFILLLIIAVLFFLRRLFYLVYVFSKKTSRDVEISLAFFYDAKRSVKGVSLVAPFYDEKKSFYFGFGLLGLKIGFTPYETITKVLTKLFQNKYLIQVCFDDMFYPSKSKLKQGFVVPRHLSQEIETYLAEKKIELIEGALIYSPETISKNELGYGITDGEDLFYICPEVTENVRVAFSGKIKEWQKLTEIEAYKKEKEFLGAEGEVFKCFELWELVYKDEKAILGFANEVFRAGVEKLFKKNRLNQPPDFDIPNLDAAFPSIINFRDIILNDNELDNLRIYMEAGHFVIYRQRGFQHDLFVKKLPLGERPSRMAQVFSCLVPRIVERKAYAKKSLIKFGVSFFCLSCYLIGIMYCMFYVMFGLLHKENDLILGITCLAAPLLAVVSLVLSVYYFSRGLFSKEEFVVTGI